jgi:hypothetical protein
MAKRIEVQIVGDASNLQRVLNNATDSTSKFGGALGTLAKTGALAAGAAGIGAVAITLRQGIKEYSEASKVAAQTNAVLKSTGEVANVSAKQVDTLATSLLKKSGIDDEVIKSGENVLLSFTKIRNEVGKGNDIFNQATEAAVDFASRTGREVPQAALLIGKALEDPATKLGGLAKAGIVFTESQKKMAEAMVKSGDTIGAQKFVLAELEKRYGGAAEAAGKTLPGQLNILKESFNNFAGDLVSKAVPSLQRFADFLNTRLIPAEGFTATLKVAWQGVSEVAVDLWGQIRDAVLGTTETIQIPTEKRIELVETEGLASKLKEQLKTAISNIDWSDVLLTVGVAIGKGVLQLQLKIWQFLFDAWKGAWGLILSTVASEGSKFVDTLITAISGLPGRFRSAIQSAMTQGVAAITGAIAGAASAALTLGTRVVSGVISGLGDIAGKVRGKLDDIKGAIAGIAGAAAGWAGSIGRAIVDGIVSGASGLGSRLAGKLIGEAQAALSRVKGFLHIGSPSRLWEEEVGIPIGEGVSVGASEFLRSNLSANLGKEITRAMKNNTLTAASAAGGTDIATTMKAGIDEFLGTNLPDNLKQVLGLAFDEATAGLDFSAVGLGVTWSPSPASIGPVGGYSGGPLVSPNTAPITVNNYAPIGSEQDLQNMVVSALAKVNGRGGIS